MSRLVTEIPANEVRATKPPAPEWKWGHIRNNLKCCCRLGTKQVVLESASERKTKAMEFDDIELFDLEGDDGHPTRPSITLRLKTVPPAKWEEFFRKKSVGDAQRDLAAPSN